MKDAFELPGVASLNLNLGRPRSELWVSKRVCYALSTLIGFRARRVLWFFGPYAVVLVGLCVQAA
jgi:hypothetical protein